MTSLVIKSEPNALMVDVSSFFSQAKMTDAQFYDFCLANQNLRIERSATGEIIVMPPAFADTGNRNIKLAQQVANWAEKDGLESRLIQCGIYLAKRRNAIPRCILDSVRALGGLIRR